MWWVGGVGVAGFLVAMWIAYDIFGPSNNTSGRTDLAGFWTTTVVLWAIGYGIVCAGSAIISPMSRPSVQAANHYPIPDVQILQDDFGFQTGEAYRLVLGSRTGGSSGETSVTTTTTAGIFTARSSTTLSGSTAPASAVSLGYSYENDYYILDIPTANIKFKVSEVKEPTVTMWLNESISSGFGEDVQTFAPYPAENCTWYYNNILPMCLWPAYEPGEGEWTSPINEQAITDTGFPTILMGTYVRAEITLTQEMYNELLGIIE